MQTKDKNQTLNTQLKKIKNLRREMSDISNAQLMIKLNSKVTKETVGHRAFICYDNLRVLILISFLNSTRFFPTNIEKIENVGKLKYRTLYLRQV